MHLQQLPVEKQLFCSCNCNCPKKAVCTQWTAILYRHNTAITCAGALALHQPPVSAVLRRVTTHLFMPCQIPAGFKLGMLFFQHVAQCLSGERLHVTTTVRGKLTCEQGKKPVLLGNLTKHAGCTPYAAAVSQLTPGCVVVQLYSSITRLLHSDKQKLRVQGKGSSQQALHMPEGHRAGLWHWTLPRTSTTATWSQPAPSLAPCQAVTGGTGGIHPKLLCLLTVRDSETVLAVGIHSVHCG